MKTFVALVILLGQSVCRRLVRQDGNVVPGALAVLCGKCSVFNIIFPGIRRMNGV